MPAIEITGSSLCMNSCIAFSAPEPMANIHVNGMWTHLLPAKCCQLRVLEVPPLILGVVLFACHIMVTLPMSHKMDNLQNLSQKYISLFLRK